MPQGAGGGRTAAASQQHQMMSVMMGVLQAARAQQPASSGEIPGLRIFESPQKSADNARGAQLQAPPLLQTHASLQTASSDEALPPAEPPSPGGAYDARQSECGSFCAWQPASQRRL